jgi:hypothetical protein
MLRHWHRAEVNPATNLAELRVPIPAGFTEVSAGNHG